MAKWLYGEPNYDALKEPLRNKEILIGGCCLSNLSPKWACFNCGFSYRKDGVGFLDHELIEKTQDNNLSILYLQDDLESKNEQTYNLPNKIIQLFNDDFLLKETYQKSIGFHFHEGGYSANHEDIRYLDGILIWNQYDSTFDYLKSNFEKQVPQTVFILPLKIKKKLNAFITSSKWKKNYFQPILDGKQWEMKRLIEKNLKTSYGSNDYPDVYLKLFEILKGIMDDLF
jgi:hypothetical protein